MIRKAKLSRTESDILETLFLNHGTEVLYHLSVFLRGKVPQHKGDGNLQEAEFCRVVSEGLMNVTTIADNVPI